MAQMIVKINGYSYTLACADGEEGHLQAMADQVQDRVTRMKAMGGQSGESRMLLLAALLMADELHDLKAGMAELRQAKPPAADDIQLQAQLAALASRAEEIAAEMERH